MQTFPRVPSSMSATRFPQVRCCFFAVLAWAVKILSTFTVCSCLLLQLRDDVGCIKDIFVYRASPPGGSCRPHPYRRRPTLSNVSNQSMQPNYNLRYQDSYSPEYPPLHRVTMNHCCSDSWLFFLNVYFCIDGLCVFLFFLVFLTALVIVTCWIYCIALGCSFSGFMTQSGPMPSGVFPQDPLAHLYEQQENLDAGALAGFGQQVVLCQLFQSWLEDICSVSKLNARLPVVT